MTGYQNNGKTEIIKMIRANQEMYVESKTPINEHKYIGWFYHYPTKLFYRWNDIPWQINKN